MCIYIYTLFHIVFHYSLLEDIEYNSLCYTVGPCLSTDYLFFNIIYLIVGLYDLNSNNGNI